MKKILLMATMLLTIGAVNAQNHIMAYDGSSSGGRGIATIAGNNVMAYDGSSSGGRGIATKVDSHLKKYDGSSSAGTGILTFKDPYMSKATFAAILLAKGIIRSNN